MAISLRFSQKLRSTRAQTLEAIAVCTEILGEPQRVGDAIQILGRTQQRVPDPRVNHPGRNTKVG